VPALQAPIVAGFIQSINASFQLKNLRILEKVRTLGTCTRAIAALVLVYLAGAKAWSQEKPRPSAAPDQLIRSERKF
jgi:hypothetical protein